MTQETVARTARTATLLEAVRAEQAGGAGFTALGHALQELIGYKVLTLLKFDVETFRSIRLFSSEPTYPIGGTKQHKRSLWSVSVVDRLIPFVARTSADVRRTFPDYAGIEAAGCGSILSAPVVFEGRPIGTLNLWNVSGFYSDEAATIVQPFAATLVPACLNTEHLSETSDP